MNGIPNCVPEYYRSLQDDYDHECELEMERNEWYRQNKEYSKQRYIDGYNELRFYPDECIKCQYGEEAKPDNEMDDMPTMICSNWRNCQVYRKDIEIAFPDVSWDEYCSGEKSMYRSL